MGWMSWIATAWREETRVSSKGSDGKDAVQASRKARGPLPPQQNPPNSKRSNSSSSRWSLDSAEIHPAHDQIDVKAYGGGFDLTRRVTAPKWPFAGTSGSTCCGCFPSAPQLLVAGVAIGKGLHNMPAVPGVHPALPRH